LIREEKQQQGQMEHQALVTFQPDGKTVSVPIGTRLHEAASKAGIDLEFPCGGHGICGKCRVEIAGEVSPPSMEEEDLFTSEELANGLRLCCQVEILGPAKVRILQRTAPVEVILQEGKEPAYEIQSPVRAIDLILPPPSVTDQRGDEERLLEVLHAQGIHAKTLPGHLLRDLPRILRDSDWAVIAILFGEDWLALHSQGVMRGVYGVAVDLGTTTVVASLHDVKTGTEFAKHGMTNRQAVCGSDVISRLSYVRERKDGLETLHRLATETLNRLIEQLVADHGIRKEEIYAVSLAGNTIMQQLFLQMDPSPIASSPFVPVCHRPTVWKARELGVEIHPEGCICVAPVIAGYVGGDIVADILASPLYESSETVVMLDLGTNAEIVLANEHEMTACACAAGPAFEGGEISQGMRAMEGAIERVWIEKDQLCLAVIGDTEPAGICGSGLVDTLAVLLETGVVDRTGRLLPPTEYPGPDWLRIRESAEGTRFVLWENGKISISLTDKDIREIQLAKGAVKAGIKILCHELGITVEKIDRVLLAGAFGSHLCPESALKVGLIPPMDLEKVHFIGNTAWVGAKMMLLSESGMRRSRVISEKMRYIELSGRIDFQSEFGLSMGFDDSWEYFGAI